jgi:DNA-binding transcriptional regulator YiaG
MGKSWTPAQLKTLREALGYSQDKLADELWVSVRTVQDWEQGRRQIPGPVAKLLGQLEESFSTSCKS